MSILSLFIERKISASQAVTETAQFFEKLLGLAKSNPATTAAVSTFGVEAQSAVNVVADWAGTALDGALAALAADINTAMSKYGAAVGLGAGTTLNASIATALQAGVAVGKAAVAHGVTGVEGVLDAAISTATGAPNQSSAQSSANPAAGAPAAAA